MATSRRRIHFGHLLTIRFAAPSRTQKAQVLGFQFVVTGLSESTEYDYLIVAKNISEEPIEQFNGTFKTQSSTPTDIENLPMDPDSAQKLLLNGTLYILHNGKMYNIHGAEVQ